MKPRLLVITLTLSLAASSLQSANAHEDSYRGQSRLFSELNLSQIQKQDISQILRQAKQDNSVFKAEKQALKQQMRALMETQVWDPDKALDIISQRIEQRADAALNVARARHQSFNLLTEAQQTEFLSQQNQDIDRGGKRKALNIDRLEKHLKLTSEQTATIEQIQSTHNEQIEGLKNILRDTKDAEKEIVFAPEFNQQAWLSLQQDAAATRIELGVANAYAHYQLLNVLDDEQKATFAKMRDKMRKGKGKGSQRGKNRKQSEDQG